MAHTTLPHLPNAGGGVSFHATFLAWPAGVRAVRAHVGPHARLAVARSWACVLTQTVVHTRKRVCNGRNRP